MKNEIPYSFPVLTGSGNYKTWARDMTFALQDAKIWSYLTEECMLPPALKETKDDDEDRQNEIFERHEARWKHEERCRKVVEKIGRMCSHTVQQEILSVKPFQIKTGNMETSPGTGKMTTISTVNITSWQVLVALQYTWTPLELWNHLKEYYTPRGWSAKWSVFKKLQQMSYQEHKNITEYEAQFREVMSEIRDQNLIMEEAVTLQFLNGLGFSFRTYLTILNEQARKDEKMPTLDSLLKNLKDEELRMSQIGKVGNYVKNRNKGSRGEPGGSGAFGGSGDKNSCYRCGSDHNANECKHKKSKCHNCGKLGHLKNKCRNEKKKKSKGNKSN